MRGAHLQLLLGQLLHAQRRGLRALFDLQAVAVQLELARFLLHAVELGEELARLVLRVNEVQRRGYAPPAAATG